MSVKVREKKRASEGERKRERGGMRMCTGLFVSVKVRERERIAREKERERERERTRMCTGPFVSVKVTNREGERER